ncbi:MULTISPECIES: hypothetical protein [Tenacibaculum]|uniref:hypothetical protein n=1 Tax=Tenacibaculum TaxID=104267 RepID=UPI001F0AE828|nr:MULTISPECIES: hypothetical protein [Tenacibaculum]MCH3882539.1 hypothetical protein [Tenacibaculum aquimarinum]MCH3885646.1 hypothetical protein [Tenacibaculum aquimarinum]MDO6599975.1 hypothetical protein [Tenacibaculum sp. 1_MG-2023]
MRKKHFGFIEMIGSFVLLILDPDRRNNKKYLDKKYNSINRIIGIITLLLLSAITLYILNKL